MDEAATRRLLREHVAWGVRPGARVVMHDDVVAAGADADAIDRYVVAGGGRRVDAVVRAGLQASGPQTRAYWLVPAAMVA